MRVVASLILVVLVSGSAQAQSSKSYRISDQAVNAGGHPTNGVVFSSASYRVTLDAIGDAVASAAFDSENFECSAGFPPAYAPPREAVNLRLAADVNLAWNPEPSVGVYNVYRGIISSLPAAAGCLLPALANPSAADAEMPPPGETFYYLVTAENRIGEEGTRGWDSSGVERPNGTPCP